jgi:hypothetical protein
MKRASHVGCNACICVLHRIYVAHMKRASSVQHTCDIYTGFAQHAHNIREHSRGIQPLQTLASQTIAL